MTDRISTDMRRAQIEARIETCRDSAAGSMIEIGRWLNAAKAEQVVPHGQWTAWVAEHAWMDERTAQGWMQAARELPPGSPLERLGITKIRSLLALEPGEREAFAEEICAERLTSREVDARVKAIKAERDEALRVIGEQKRQMREQADKHRRELMETDMRGVAKGKESSAGLIKEQSEELDRMRQSLDAARLARLEQESAQAEEIQRLRSTLEARESEIDRLTDELDSAQTAAMRGAMTGEGERRNPATAILSSIGALMAEAGNAPGELARMQGGLDPETRQLLAAQAHLTGQWAMSILAACGEVDGYA